MIKKLVRRVLHYPPSPRDAFLSWHYQRHNQRRLEHLASLSLDLAGSSVLEVGAGIGDHTSYFLDRGCRVVSTDAREDNLEILRSRYPNIRVERLDLDDHDGSLDEVFDVVYCYGVLYHLAAPARAIEFLSDRCRRLLLLESCVSPGDSKTINPCKEPAEIPSQSVSGRGCRPTRRWIYSCLKRSFEFVYMPITQPWHEEFPTDWDSLPPSHGLIRSVFVASREHLENDLLVEGIPMQQTRH